MVKIGEGNKKKENVYIMTCNAVLQLLWQNHSKLEGKNGWPKVSADFHNIVLYYKGSELYYRLWLTDATLFKETQIKGKFKQIFQKLKKFQLIVGN